MTTVNDIADIVRIIREQPEWADTLRSVLLSRELLELPQRFAEYAESTNRRLERLETVLTDFIESTNRRLEALEIGQATLQEGQAKLEESHVKLEAGQTKLEAGQTKLEAGQAKLEASHVRLEAGQMEIRADIDEIRTDISAIREDLRPIKGTHARSGAERDTRRIARTMNCFQVHLLNSDDLYHLLAELDSDDISRSDRDSFENADIVIVGEHRQTGETHYIAVEASFTAHEDDTRRAIRNADYLTRSTGQPAHAVVASSLVDPSVEPIFASGRVHWYEIPRRYLESD